MQKQKNLKFKKKFISKYKKIKFNKLNSALNFCFDFVHGGEDNVVE